MDRVARQMLSIFAQGGDKADIGCYGQSSALHLRVDPDIEYVSPRLITAAYQSKCTYSVALAVENLMAASHAMVRYFRAVIWSYGYVGQFMSRLTVKHRCELRALS